MLAQIVVGVFMTLMGLLARNGDYVRVIRKVPGIPDSKQWLFFVGIGALFIVVGVARALGI